MSKYSMIKDAQALATVGNTPHYATLQEAQKQFGKPLHEVAALLPEAISMKVTPDDYDEWIRQVVMQGEALKRDGATINLNRRSVFNDLLGEILENDPAGKVNLGDDQLVKHIFDAVWKRYQGTRDHLKVQNVVKAREEEEALHRQMDAWAEKGMEDEERDVMVAPQPEETDEFKPSEGRYDDEDMAGAQHEPVDGDDMYADDMGSEIPEECPFDEGTPECDAWMAGYEAALQAQDDDMGEEGMDDAEGSVDVEQEDGVDYEAGQVDGEAGAEASAPQEEMPAREPEARRPMPVEDEEHNSTHWRNQGYLAAKAEYHHQRKATPPKNPYSKRQWERGYESFMQDTEGQRELARHASEDNETSLFKSVISKPRDTLNQALKHVEDEGATAFDSLKLPKNPHPTNSLAQKAWAKGFKNAVRGAFGFNEKPVLPAKKRKR